MINLIIYPALVSLLCLTTKDMTNVQEEIWKKTINGKYEISNLGRLKATGKQKKIVKLFTSSRGYYRYSVFSLRKNFTIHRLVAEAFIPNPNKCPQVNHKDGNKLNNNVSNLEWCTQSENMTHADKTGLRIMPKGKNHCGYGKFRGNSIRAKLVIDLQTGIFYESVVDAAETFSLGRSYLSMMLSGRCKNKTNLAYA